MSNLPPSGRRRLADWLSRIPAVTWVGICAAVFFGAIGALAGGFWLMLVLLAVLVLLTAVYGLIFRRITWLHLPRKRAAAAVGTAVALTVLIGSLSAYGAEHPSPPASPGASEATSANVASAGAAAGKTHEPTPSSTPTPVVTTQLVTETDPVPFATTTVDGSALAKGVSEVTTTGVNGVETKTYAVTYTNGTETSRTLQSDVVTQQPVTQVTTVGTYVAPPPPPPAPAAPACANGTYVNSAGNTVCRPEVSAGAPAGATAKCVDGTYSFSQSRRGTCSSHGGVAAWL